MRKKASAAPIEVKLAGMHSFGSPLVFDAAKFLQ